MPLFNWWTYSNLCISSTLVSFQVWTQILHIVTVDRLAKIVWRYGLPHLLSGFGSLYQSNKTLLRMTFQYHPTLVQGSVHLNTALVCSLDYGYSMPFHFILIKASVRFLLLVIDLFIGIKHVQFKVTQIQYCCLSIYYHDQLGLDKPTVLAAVKLV